MREEAKGAKFGCGFVAALVCGLIAIAGLGVVAFFCLFSYFLMPYPEKAKEDIDAKNTTQIAKACETYKLMHGDYPRSLEALTERIGNDPPILEPEVLKPKSKPGGHFEYDRNGPQNSGLTVDVWIDCPSGRRRGN